MVFGAHGKPLVGRVQARPLGNGPAFEDAVYFETEVPMETCGGMFLHDEAVAGFLGDSAFGFARAPEITLGIIGCKRVLGTRHRSSPRRTFLSQ